MVRSSCLGKYILKVLSVLLMLFFSLCHWYDCIYIIDFMVEMIVLYCKMGL